MSEWKKVRIGDFLKRVKMPARVEPTKKYQLVTVRMHHQGVVQREEKLGKLIGSNMHRVSKGQFILSGIDARNGAFGVVPEELDGAVVTNDFWYFDIDDRRVSRDFFLWLTSTPLFLDACIKSSEGTTNRRRLQPDRFFNFEFVFPEIQEQERLLRKLSGTGSVNDEMSNELDHQLTLLKQLRQAILQEAVEGKLTADWRKKNPVRKGNPEFDAGALLEKIRGEKEKLIEDGKIRKEKPLAPIEDVEKPFEAPEGWRWCRLGDAGLFGRGKSKHRPRNDPSLFTGGSIPFVQTGEVSQSKHRGFQIDRANRFYNEKGLSQSTLWSKGTLCITIAANIAETGFLAIDACFPDSVVGFSSLTGEALSWFVRHYLSGIQDDIIKFAPATARKNINLDILGSLLFPLPPLAEQRAIVSRVDSLMSTLTELEQQITARKSQSEMLMQSVLREAFEGGQNGGQQGN